MLGAILFGITLVLVLMHVGPQRHFKGHEEKCEVVTLDEAIARWRASRPEMTLQEFLLMTDEEYHDLMHGATEDEKEKANAIGAQEKAK